MTVMTNVVLVLKDSEGNIGIVKPLTDKDIIKIADAITDVGQVVDPATHTPIEATTASVGVVQLATAQDIKDGTANKVVDAKELADVVTKIKYAGSANLNNPFSLFEPKWYPMKISNLSWILSDGTWYNGDIYIGAYNKLVEAYENGTAKSDTIGGVTVSYRLSSDGLRVTTDKSSVDSLYSATGTAWYFVIDTTNRKFVLPRSKAFMQFGDEPGKFTEAGLPDITGDFNAYSWSDGISSGCFSSSVSNPSVVASGPTERMNYDYFSFAASRSSSVYGKSPTVQPNSVTGYLYFYVGDIERDANIINVQELVADLKDQLARFSAAAGENINAVGTPTVTYNDGTFTFNYLKGEKGDKGDKGDTPDTANYANSAGNADTVDGTHAWQMQTLASNGNTHGPTDWLMYCQYSVDGDNYFKLCCGDRSIGTKVDRANSSSWADSAGSVSNIWIG